MNDLSRTDALANPGAKAIEPVRSIYKSKIASMLDELVNEIMNTDNYSDLKEAEVECGAIAAFWKSTSAPGRQYDKPSAADTADQVCTFIGNRRDQVEEDDRERMEEARGWRG